MFPGGSNLLLQPDSAVKVYREYAVLQRGGAVPAGPPRTGCEWVESIFLISARCSLCRHAGQVSYQGGRSGRSCRGSQSDGWARGSTGAGKGAELCYPGSAAELTRNTIAADCAPGNGCRAGPTTAGVQLTLHGILRKDHPGRYGHYLLTDVATNVTYELQGSGLDDLVGASVEVTGSTFDTARRGRELPR